MATAWRRSWWWWLWKKNQMQPDKAILHRRWWLFINNEMLKFPSIKNRIISGHSANLEKENQFISLFLCARLYVNHTRLKGVLKFMCVQREKNHRNKYAIKVSNLPQSQPQIRLSSEWKKLKEKVHLSCFIRWIRCL